MRFEELVKKYYGKPITFVLHKQQRARPGEAVLRVHGAGQGGRLRHRLAGAHVDLLEGGAVHRRAVPVPRPRPLEQGARRRPAQAGRRRGEQERRGDADRLRRRRHAQHLRQQAGAQPGRDEGPEGARAGRADLEPDLQRDRHEPDGDRLQRGLQRDPEQRHRRRRERSRRRRGDEVLRGGAAPVDDAARDHDPADLLLRPRPSPSCPRTCRTPSQGRQGSRRLRPPDRELGRRGQARWRWRRAAS